jgi:hypothetical protein
MALPLLLLSDCQCAIDRVVPGEEPRDGISRLLQVQQDKSPRAGSGAPGSPALVYVEARAGDHLAIWIDGGTVRDLDAHQTAAASEQCVVLPELRNGVSRAQFLVESSLTKFTVQFGLVTAGVEVGSAGSSGMVSTGDVAKYRLEHICPGARLLDLDEVTINGPGATEPVTAGGDNAGGDSGAGGANDEPGTTAGTGAGSGGSTPAGGQAGGGVGP